MKPVLRSRLRRGVAAAVAALILSLAPATAGLASPAPASASAGVPDFVSGVNDFTFASFDAVYELSRDADGRSRLRVTETLVAVFPDFPQNRGILRAIPTSYDGHLTQLEIESTTDEAGRAYPRETSFEDGNIVLQIGDTNTYLTGTHTFVITYTMRDVTRYFADTDDDEFYWDTNGLMWPQSFGSVTAHIVLGEGLAERLNGAAACYYGSAGSTTPCEITETATGYDATVNNLGSYENLTVAIGFEKGTFTEAPFDLFSYVPITGFLGLAATAGGLLLALVLRLTVLRGARGTGIVIAQYEPADDISPLLAANLVKKTKRGMAASIVDLAVRHKIRIVERPAEGLFASGSLFGVQRVANATLSPDESAVMNALFMTSSRRLLRGLLGGVTPGVITVGTDGSTLAMAGDSTEEVRWLAKKDQTLGQHVVALTKAASNEAQRRGLRSKPPKLAVFVVGALIVVGFLLLLFTGINAQSEISIVVGVLGSIVAAWVGVGALVMVGGQRPLTKAGALAVEHLEGLREYIRLAEADRLQMLQSVTGAERTTAAGQPDVIKIYEKLLPYAVIFGLEKEWAAELATYYDTTPPDWYEGSNVGAFNVGVFAASIGSLSSSVSTSFSGSASSSSSGGSSGGGSSGGGGGGGGGGGF